MRIPFPLIAFVGGILLIGLGLLAYLGFATGDDRSVTALIPLFWGVPIVIAVLVSIGGGNVRKHAMHFVAILALLGMLAPLGRLIPTSIKNGFVPGTPRVFTMIAMSVICLVLLILAIGSFIEARKARKATAA